MGLGLSSNISVLEDLVDPLSEVRDPGVDARLVLLSAPDAPTDHSGEHVPTVFQPLHRHGTPGIALNQRNLNPPLFPKCVCPPDVSILAVQLVQIEGKVEKKMVNREGFVRGGFSCRSRSAFSVEVWKAKRCCVDLTIRNVIFTSQESFPPSLYPAQMNMWGMCSRKPAFSYIISHSVLLMIGRVTFCILEGRGPSAKRLGLKKVQLRVEGGMHLWWEGE